ncbi:MAG: hypothetical protein OS112_03270 [Methanoregula sp.]|nr:MAG: hypothetical protein OS112_03270 [Methanoregula sp.]
MIPPGYKEVEESDPYTITVPGEKQSLFPGIDEFWVLSYVIRVRSMGTASYIALGSIKAEEYRLTGIGQTFSYSCNPGELINLSKKWIVSDTADAVIEVIVSAYKR